MDPKSLSALTTVLAIAIGAGLRHFGGALTDNDQAALTPALTTVALTLGGAGIVWWKASRHTPQRIVEEAVLTQPAATARAIVQTQPAATIQAINAEPNGVKVVSDAAPGLAVSKPLIGRGS